MLGKKLLTRLTRFGLAMYATTWCMSFTVCAYEDPVAELAVADKVAVLAEAEASGDAFDENGNVTEDLEVTDPTVTDEKVSSEEAAGGSSDAVTEGDSETEIEPSDNADAEAATGENAEADAGETEETAEAETEAEETEEIEEIEEAEDAVIEDIDAEAAEEDVVEVIDEEELLTGGNSTESTEVQVLQRIYFSETNLTVDNLDKKYSFPVYSVFDGTIPVENLTFALSPNGDFYVDDTVDEPEIYNSTYENATIIAGSTSYELDVSQVKNDLEFYVVARYVDENEKEWFAKCLVKVNYYYKRIEYLRFDNDFRELTNTSDFNISITGFSRTDSDIFGDDSDCSRLDPARITWGFAVDYDDDIQTAILADEYMGATIVGKGLNATVSFAEVKGPINLIVVARYDNEEDFDATGECYLTLNLPFAAEELEAFTVEKSFKIQVYQANSLPIFVRYKNGSRADQFTSYDVEDVSFTNDTLNEYFAIYAYDENFYLQANSSLINDREAVDSLVKGKGVKTNVSFIIRKGSYNATLTTNEFTLTFGNTLPDSKTVKFSNSLAFNSYCAGNDTQMLNFTDMLYNWGYHARYEGDRFIHIEPIDMPKFISYNNETRTFNTVLEELPAKSVKGTFKVAVCFKDEDYEESGWESLVSYYDLPYRLPKGFNVTVPVSYSVKNDPAVIKLDKNTVTLNKITGDSDYVFAGYSKYFDGTTVDFEILNSKGKAIDGDKPLNVSVYNEEESYGAYISILTNNRTDFGATYKVRLYPVSKTGIKGASKDVKVSIVSQKNSQKYSVSLMQVGKGIIDASVPYSNITFKVSSKNVAVLNGAPSFSVFCGDENITDKFYIFRYAYDQFVARERFNSSTRSPQYFNLSRSGYAGKAITINATFTTYSGENISASLKTKIGNSAVTPKFEVSKLSVNPVYTTKVRVNMTHSGAYFYNYNVTWDFGKKDHELNSQFYANASGRILSIIYNYDNASLYGKTCTVSVTPMNNRNEDDESTIVGKTATFKLTFLDPGKSKNNPAITSKVKGTIDSLDPSTYVNISMSFKNFDVSTVYEYGNPENVRLVSVFKSGVKNPVNEADKFEFYVSSPSMGRLRQDFDQNVSSGTYKANITYTITYPENRPVQISTIATFKVKRSSIGLKLITTKQSVANRCYNTKLAYRFSFKKMDQRLFHSEPEVRLSDADSKIFDAEFDGTSINDVSVVLTLKPGYVFTQKVKGKTVPITKAITKRVPVYVYYGGSTEPDRMTLTVKVLP